MARKQVDNFTMDERIGGGSYGEVWRARDSRSSMGTVALRVVSRQGDQRNAKVRRLQNEVRVLRQVRHTNILSYYGLRKTTSRFYMALEYCAGGNLAQLLQAKGPFPEADSWRFCVQITAGLLALHCQRMLHGNLQPRNVLLKESSNHNVKLANFVSVASPTPYTAPEVLSGEPCSFQADMWSAGAVLYEMLFGRLPVRGESRSQLLSSHLSSEVDFDGPHKITEEGRAFCRSLLGRHCSERLSSEECAQHTYMTRGPQLCAQEAILLETKLWRKIVPFPQFSFIPVSINITWSALANQCLRHVFGLPHGIESNEIGLARKHELGRNGEDIVSPIKSFVVGQLRASHLFFVRTSRLFPRILY